VFETCREVGFRVMPESLADFIGYVLDKLANQHADGAVLAAVLPAGRGAA
jgi:hypothetical protein